MIPTQSIGWMRDGEQLLARTIDTALSRDEPSPLDAASLLPGWNRATLIAHVAGNAGALLNLLRWADTGVETPMYASPRAREEDIAQWSAADPLALLGHVAHTRGELDDAVRTLPERGWSEKVQTSSGRIVEARVVPWMRVREVYVHAVDLDAGTSFADVPADVRTALIDDVVKLVSAKPDCPVVALQAGDQHWRLGSTAGPVADGGPQDATTVQGSDSALLAWLTGRSEGIGLSSSDPLPALPPWL